MGVRSFQRRTARNVAGVLVLAGFLANILLLIERVRTGRGIDLFRTGYGLEVGAVSVLTLLGVVLLALVGAATIRWASRRWPSDHKSHEARKSARP